MLNNTVFFKSKRQVKIGFMFALVLYTSSSIYANGNDHALTMRLDLKPIIDLTETINSTKNTVKSVFSQDISRIGSLTMIQGTSLFLCGVGMVNVYNEINRKEEIRYQRIMATTGCMIGCGLIFAYSRNINNWFFPLTTK